MMRQWAFGLTLVGVVISIATLGAGQAGATTVCEVNESPCPLRPYSGLFKANSVGSITITTGISVVVTCTTSAIGGEVKSNGEGTITSFSLVGKGKFGSCSTNQEISEAKVEVSTLPAPFKFSYLGVIFPQGALKTGELTVKINFSGLFVCIFHTGSFEGVVDNGNGEVPSTLLVTEAGLTKKLGSEFCGETASLSGEYTLQQQSGGHLDITE